jgi:hypothetical protein
MQGVRGVENWQDTAKTLTGNSSVNPNNLRKRADNVTERVNAMLPSPVF